jgi:putative ABC transport system substrate-binding protein
LNRLPALAAELVRLKVDVIVSTSTPTTRAAMNASRTIPIVMNAGSPVSTGLIASLARPGGNVTGVTVISGPGFRAKQLEMLKEVAPSVRRIATLGQPANAAIRVALKAMQAAAPALGMTLHLVSTEGKDDIDSTLAKLKKERPDALHAFGFATSSKYRKRIVEFAAQNRIPAIWPNPGWMKSGGLMSYAADHVELARQKAIYVDRILKGENPGEMPVQRPRKFDLIINLKTAKKIGLTIPPEFLFRATKVIK